MNLRFTLLAVVFVLLCSPILEVKAQRAHNAKFRSSIRTSYNYRFKPIFTLTGGVGLAVMNSDNWVPGGEINLSSIHKNGLGPVLNVGAVYQLSSYLGVLANIDYASIKGNEENGVTQKRYITFKSNSVGVSGSLVVNLVNGYTRARSFRTRRERPVVPYVKAGIGFLSYSATSSQQGVGELPAETAYPAVAAVIPVGLGVKFNLSEQISFAPEFNLHITTTDYLDNRKIDGNTFLTSNDLFASSSVKLLYTPSAKRSYGYRSRRWR